MTREPLQVERAHGEPAVVQFSTFLPNQVGKLREYLSMFVGQGVHVVALDVIDSIDWAVVRTIFSDAARGRAILQKAGLSFTECRVLAVELPGPDALLGVAQALLQAELNLHVIYPLLISAHNRSVVAVHTDDLSTASEVLAEHKFRLLDQSDLWPE